MSFTISSIGALLRAYRSGEVRPRDVLAPALKRLQADQHRAWIQLIDEAALDGYLQLLEQKNADDLPLYGVPFAIKDNIDLAGVPTTAACPAFAYTPEASAPVVQALIDAGA
ncbi:MAG TPA: allophanate hydrolase, partial [Porticoccaceae bacterium]|nr:allophanate hydrolase [Porticoccaceae bacterium]